MHIVAVDGFEPPTQPLTASSKPTELYGIPFYILPITIDQAMRGSHTPLLPLQTLSQPAIWAHALLVLALRSLDLRSFNTPLLPWLIRPTSLTSHSSLGLTLLPIPVPVAPRPTRERLDSEITLSPPAVLTDWVPSLSTPSACWSVSMPFRGGHSRYGYPGDTIHHVTLFLPTYRDCTLHVPWRLWKVKDSNLRCLALRFIIN